MIQEQKPTKTKVRRMFISLSRRKADSPAAVLPVVGARLRPQENLDLQPKGSPALAPNHQQAIPLQRIADSIEARQLPSPVLSGINGEPRLTGEKVGDEEGRGNLGKGSVKKKEGEDGGVRKPLLISSKSEQPKIAESELGGEQKKELLASRSLPAFKDERKTSFTRNASLSTEEARKRLKSWKKTTIYRKKSQLH